MVKIKDIREELPKHSNKTYAKRTQDQIKRIVLHCTGPLPNGDNEEIIRKIATYDVNPGNHISDTGCPAYTYHYTIGKRGEIFYTLGLEDISWHCGLWNPGSIGIVMLFDPKDINNETPSVSPDIEQIDSAVRLSAALCLKLGLKPNCVGHRELKGTGFTIFKGSRKLRKTCPGLVVDLDKYRYEVAKHIQRTLLLKGFYNDKIDGIFGKKSLDALKRYYLVDRVANHI